jgi:hypothetical protein
MPFLQGSTCQDEQFSTDKERQQPAIYKMTRSQTYLTGARRSFRKVRISETEKPHEEGPVPVIKLTCLLLLLLKEEKEKFFL